MTEKRNRFPGAKPFTAEDREVFHGREKDIDKLFELLKVKRMIVLYAESGIGKSSLVNAGLVPKYDASSTGSRFLAVKIRFGLSQFTDDDKGTAEILLTRVIEELSVYKNLLTRKDVPFVDEKIENSLWYQVKLFERNGLKLLLAFDQFEEVFAYSKEQVNRFKEELFSVFSGVPKDINSSISEKIKQVEEHALGDEELIHLDEDLKFIYAPLSTQILYIIREDKLGFFNSFTDYFPDILKDTFKLLPLSRGSAIEAITLPATREGNFKTAPFTFSHLALEKLLKQLAEKNGTFDPFTIQLTCRYLEKTLVDEAGKREIEENDIPNVEIIVKDFIDSTWKALPISLQKQVDHYKETIETKLIARDIEKRISVHEGKWLDERVISVLMNEGLLKRDRRGGVDYIELSHDRLIKPLLDDFKFRRQQEKIRKQRKNNSLAAVAVLAVLSIGIFFIINNKIRETDTLVEQADSLNKSQVQLKQSIASKTNIIEHYVKKENFDSAKIFAFRATQLAKSKDYKEADVLFKKAIAASFKADDNSNSDSLSSLRKKLIPQSTINETAENSIYKIDVFYDERTLPESENTADWVLARLEKNKGFIIRKKLLTIARIAKNPTWNIQNNLIRHEQNKQEKTLADSLVNDFNSALFFTDNGDKIFGKQEVRTGFSTPNYISIFVHN